MVERATGRNDGSEIMDYVSVLSDFMEYGCGNCGKGSDTLLWTLVVSSIC